MKQPYVSNLFKVRPAFLRSVDVVVDYEDPGSSDHYVATNLVYETLQRISSGLQFSSSQRAWRITGDYGTGKSSFALALARIASGQNERLPLGLRSWGVKKDVRLEPLLVTGDLESLRNSILRGIRETELRIFGDSECKLSLNTNDEILHLIDQLGNRIRQEKIGDGLLLILDELGQNLRYAAQNPEDDNIFLLQRLGERAVRSNKKAFMVVALLHQGFASYSAAADSVAKKEWEKVAGRYEEIVFAQPLEQAAVLLAETLDIQVALLSPPVIKKQREMMNRALNCGFYGPLVAEKSLTALAPRLFPLNPFVLPILVALLRKFGQNERSIVSFLTSFEPFGLRSFSDRVKVGQALYEISDLYDYFKANLSHLSTGPSRAKWDIAESVVNKGTEVSKTAEKLLKVTAILNMVDEPSLPSVRETLLASNPNPDASETIEKLVSKYRLLHERGVAKGLSLWPHTSVNLEDLLREACEASKCSSKLPNQLLLEYLPQKQLVARRHYVETGNLRHFEVQYVYAKDAEKVLQGVIDNSFTDGSVVVIVPFSKEEFDLAVKIPIIQTLPKHVVVGLSPPVVGVSHILTELKHWEWVWKNSKELSFDQFARGYVREEIGRLKTSLHQELDFLTEFVVDRKRQIQWFYLGNEVRIERYRGIAGYLSTVCEELYPHSPIVLNELINRRVTSSAASRARTLLIEAVANKPTLESLGLDDNRNPPELAIYLSVIKGGALHVQDGDSWRFVSHEELVKDPCRLAPCLSRIHELLLDTDLSRVSVDQIYAELRRPPFGVRDGLLPLIVAIYLAGHWQETSVYEDGTFLLKVGGEEFQRLNKEPEAFSLQHCSVCGVRLEVYHQLSRVLGTEPTQRPDVLTVVRPLVSFAVSLPEYVRNTHETLSPESRKVKDLLFAAREPAKLLFKDLPKALGFPTINSGSFDLTQIAPLVSGLSKVVTELQEAYPALLTRIRGGLLEAFGLKGSWEESRELMARRSVSIADRILDLEFKSFVLRLADKTLADREWVESIATLVSKKPPERWRDSDEVVYFENLSFLVPRFLRVEATGFNGAILDPEKSKRCVRFTVTRPDGSEADEVLHWTPDDDLRIQEVGKALDLLVSDHGNIALAAAAQLFLQKQAVNDK